MSEYVEYALERMKELREIDAESCSQGEVSEEVEDRVFEILRRISEFEDPTVPLFITTMYEAERQLEWEADGVYLEVEVRNEGRNVMLWEDDVLKITHYATVDDIVEKYRELWGGTSGSTVGE